LTAPRLREFRFLLRDVSLILERDYFGTLRDSLVEAMKPDNEERIRQLTGSLLSDLVDRGWTMETLFGWPHNFLVAPPKRTFTENLLFMFRVLEYPPQDYEVTLRLSKGSNLQSVGTLGGFAFSVDSGLNADNATIAKFANPSQAVCFAKTVVRDFDFRSAAISAMERLDDVVDLLRFGFEPNKLDVDDTGHVKRVTDSRQELILVKRIPPNPIEEMRYEDFVSFTKDVDIIGEKSVIEEESRRRLQAAIRQYRFGRDTDSYRDKFLYWWMGLEALAYTGGPIGPTVTRNVSNAMAILYLRVLLQDLADTLKYCKIGWPRELAEASGAKELVSLSPSELLVLTERDETRRILASQCASRPTVSYFGSSLLESMSDPHKTAARLRLHLQHLEWQMSRLYRIRCCIVHGSDVRCRLGLFAANLEYYLRETILTCMDTFKANNHISTLEELFLRASLTRDRLLSALDKPGSSAKDTREAVFSGLVLAR
jgi:hypothetical protein